jgi:hypothetical protein
MKKLIILAVFALISMSTVRGQSKVEPSTVVASEFNKQFNGATHVIWEKTGTVSYASFHFQQNLMVAYFDRSGNLIAKARKINTDQLPMSLQSELLAVKNDREKKSGVLSIGNIFEYSTDADTQYVTSLENDSESIIVGTVNGKMTVRNKLKKESNVLGTPKDLIAKGLSK